MALKNTLRGASICNHRQAGESATDYRARRRFVNQIIESALQGRYATHSRAKPWRETGLITEALETGQPMRYVPGPHRSHQPHEVTQEGFKLSPLGVLEPHTFRVMHPGTLVKERAE